MTSLLRLIILVSMFSHAITIYADHHTPAGSHDEKEDESPETCYLHQEKFGKLAEQSSLSQGAFIWPPKQSYLARIKEVDPGTHVLIITCSILAPQPMGVI